MLQCKYLGSILASDYPVVGLSQLLKGIHLQQPPFVTAAYYETTHREAAARKCPQQVRQNVTSLMIKAKHCKKAENIIEGCYNTVNSALHSK